MPITDPNNQETVESSQPHYLFVDDDVLILNLFQDFFGKKAEVSLANDGHEALEKISAQHFDAVVSDVDMPTLNGIGLFKILNAMDSSLCKKFLFCSGSSSHELQELCSKYQVPFLSKPIRLTTLQAELSGFCDG